MPRLNFSLDILFYHRNVLTIHGTYTLVCVYIADPALLSSSLNALETFRKNIDLPVEIKTEAIEQPTYLDLKADRLLRIVVQGTELHFYAEVKANITNIALANVVIYKIKEVHLPYKVLLITRYVTPQLAEKLKQENIQFIDTAGNAYINHPPLYIFVKGNKLPDTFRRVPLKRIFKPTGLKLTYAFLCNPGLENRPYREIAAVADVALGTVGWVMRDLKETGYLLDMGKKGKQLIERENLLNRWITAYPEQLKPKLLLGLFRGAPDWWSFNRFIVPNNRNSFFPK